MMAGFQTHVAKPVEPAELLAAVASLAGRVGRQPGGRGLRLRRAHEGENPYQQRKARDEQHERVPHVAADEVKRATSPMRGRDRPDDHKRTKDNECDQRLGAPRENDPIEEPRLPSTIGMARDIDDTALKEMMRGLQHRRAQHEQTGRRRSQNDSHYSHYADRPVHVTASRKIRRTGRVLDVGAAGVDVQCYD
jgi:hypothetical protein